MTSKTRKTKRTVIAVKKPAATSVTIIGTGLIGTSIGLALQRGRAGARTRVTGWDPRKAALNAARKRGGVARAATSFAQAVRGAHIIVLAAPLDAIVKMLPRVIEAADPGALVIDVGAVKARVVPAAERLLKARPDVLFVSGHPMTGREKSGAAHAGAALFDAMPFAIVVPGQANRHEARSAAAAFARRLGGLPLVLEPKVHDRLVAATSALPQLASIALALAVEMAAGSAAKKLAGTGYRDATRLAASPYNIWRPALAANALAVRDALRALRDALYTLTAAVEEGDEKALARYFSRAAAARRRVVGG